MQVTSAEYTEDGQIKATVDGDVVFVPDDSSNRHRQAIAEWEAEGNTIKPKSADEPTSGDVTAERDRRIAAGFTFNGKVFDFDNGSKQRVAGAATLAGFAIAAGAQTGNLLWHGGTAPFTWIAADNSVMTMDAQTCFAFGQVAAEHETAHIFAARALKDMVPIPADYVDDVHWPS